MIYDKLISERVYNENELNLNGNDRLYVVDEGEKYSFRTAPVDLERGMFSENGKKCLRRYLFFVKPNKTTYSRRIGPDFLEQPDFKITLPYHGYGTVINSKCDFEIFDSTVYGIYQEKKDKPQWMVENNTAVLTDGSYTMWVITDGTIKYTDYGICIKSSSDTNTIIGYGITSDFAKTQCEGMFNNLADVIKESKCFWESYFNSCPVVNDADEECVIRQYWHWWCALIAVSNVEFNKFPLYMSPARENWLGTWSNDGPETMAAMSLTNQSDIARKLIVNYIEAAINEQGIHSWYLHSDGTGCYSKEGDVGCLSHGVPNIIHTLDFYIRNTGDKSILSEKSNEITVYAKIKKYFYKLFEIRDLDNDGLIEWRNLWETGWDDKLGCFFKTASLEEWANMASNYSEEEKTDFYIKNSYPVISIVEQVYLKWAILSMKKMALLMDDINTVDFCEDKYNLNEQNFHEKLWNEKTGFYFDYNIRENHRNESKSADSFYALYFEKDANRIKRITEKLTDKNAFGNTFIPMQAMDCEGFSPTGYWSGGHWPREMSYLSLGLWKSGHKQLAKETVIKAIMTGKGDCLYEVCNPFDGRPTTKITKMAYDILNVVALLCIEEKIEWE